MIETDDFVSPRMNHGIEYVCEELTKYQTPMLHCEYCFTGTDTALCRYTSQNDRVDTRTLQLEQ